MAGHAAPNIVEDGLVFLIDAANPRSTIPSASTTKTFNLKDTSISGSFINDTMYDSSSISPSYAFDGTGDYITIDGFNDITVNTVSAWFKLSFTTNTVMMEKGTNAKMMFQPNSDEGIYYANLKFYYPGSGYASSVMDGTWKNWVQIEDTDFSYFYVNGVLQNSQANTSNSTNSSPLVIMSRNGGSYSQLGNVGPIQIYNRALSAQEVLQNYNALKGRFN
tara:strand:- start:2667 stop:3326 length:660 start_codon:yes stop_codon:yes gene_type:complete